MPMPQEGISPRRPSLRAGNGLPAGPRSWPAVRSRPEEPSQSYNYEPITRSTNPSSLRRVRPQQMVFIPPSRDRSEPLPMLQPQRQPGRIDTNQYTPPDTSRREPDSSTSTSSAASSFLDRMRNGGYTSSRTSLEEDYKPTKRGLPQEVEHQMLGSSMSINTALDTGHGQTLWERLAYAAGNLNVDVGKSWAVKLTAHSGEDTPPGQESRLTRAMKAYHLAKARDPRDLPEWLFEANELRPTGRSRFADSQGRHATNDQEPGMTPQNRGLRDIYDAAATNSKPKPMTTIAHNRFANEPAMHSKTTVRLKALRDARRHHGHSDDSQEIRSTSSSDVDGPVDGQRRSPLDKRPLPRVGLPSRPGSRREI